MDSDSYSCMCEWDLNPNPRIYVPELDNYHCGLIIWGILFSLDLYISHSALPYFLVFDVNL